MEDRNKFTHNMTNDNKMYFVHTTFHFKNIPNTSYRNKI